MFIRFLKPALAIAVILLSGGLLILSHWGCGGSTTESRVLARVEVPGYLEDLDLPVYADIEDGDENYYALVIVPQSQLDRAGVTYRIIDADAPPGTRYLIAREDFEGARAEAAELVKVLYDDGEHIIVRYKPELSELLPEIGFDLKMMSDKTINYIAGTPAASAKVNLAATPASLTRNAKVEKMLGAVTEAAVQLATEQLSGEKQVTIDGALETLSSRHTYRDDSQVQKATQYVYEQLKGMGLTASYANWTVEYGGEPLSNRNVIGEIQGQTNPKEIVILIAHLDTISKVKDGKEPGADDNASGCVGLLTAAKIMKSYNFKRTVRFVFTTGEEQSLFGGTAYAEAIHKERQNVVAVLNLDMIGYSKATTPYVKPKQQIKIRNWKNRTGNTKDLPIAQTYVDVVNTYNWNDTRKLSDIFDAVIEDDGESNSDHAPFWDLMAECLQRDSTAACYPAAWAIEYAEKGYLNPEMHSANDRFAIMNLAYYTAVVKAALGTVAHLAETVD